jgi:hypothetical protein
VGGRAGYPYYYEMQFRISGELLLSPCLLGSWQFTRLVAGKVSVDGMSHAAVIKVSRVGLQLNFSKKLL